MTRPRKDRVHRRQLQAVYAALAADPSYRLPGDATFFQALEDAVGPLTVTGSGGGLATASAVAAGTVSIGKAVYEVGLKLADP